MNKMIKCDKVRKRYKKVKVIDCTHSAPLFWSPTHTLIHRVRNVCIYDGEVDPGRLLVDFWCGGSSCRGSDDNLFFDVPSKNRFVCARCEYAARLAGLQTVDELLGHHVHIGSLRPVQECCK